MNLKDLIFGGGVKSGGDGGTYRDSIQAWLPIKNIIGGVVITKDGRFVKILELLPVNIYLKSPNDRQNIISSFAAYLKIAPNDLQMVARTLPADTQAYVEQMQRYGWHLNDNYALAYRVLQSVCGIQRGSQPYSHMKKAELVLKGYVSESSSTQLTSLNIAINGGLAMGHYWKGRLLLEQAKQEHDRCNDYKDAAIASFCATNVTERFDHLPENADEDAAPQLSPPQWLSAIELLRYPDRVDFRVDRRMVFQAIHQKLAQQVEEVQSDSIQIHNERYRLTKKDIRSNLERCLDMVKAQFPDKVPLIQEMIRSIR